MPVVTLELALFARRPLAGRVKTRLTPALPAELARDLYLGLLADALAVTAAARSDERTLYWDARGERPGEIEWPDGVRERIQDGPDLGARLAAAFEALLVGGSARAVVIGADCPELTASVVERAFDQLAVHDLVLGPTRDGGYYLIGLARPARSLLEGISWSTDRVLAQTLARARAAGLRAAQLETLDDLDTPDDLARLAGRALVAGPRFPGRHTAAALAALGLLPPRRP
jgi:rSAM/selenodomain-associated transferase 1